MPTESVLAVQSVVYADRSLSALLGELRTVPVDPLELWTGHLAPADGEATIAAAEDSLADADVSVVGYGVVDLAAPGDVRPYAALAAAVADVPAALDRKA